MTTIISSHSSLLSPFRLPRVLLMKVEGCDGDADAFYEKNVIRFVTNI
jgi:hypothetical protein